MNPPPQVIRRLVMTPITWVGALVLTCVSLLLFPIAVMIDLFDRRSWRSTRLLSLGIAFCALEFAALSAGFGVWVAHIFDRDQASRTAAFQGVLAWWLRSITTSLRRCLNFSFDVRFPETGDAPLIVLSRHAGPGDALFLMDELANVQHRRIRAIGKGKLLWDPFFEQVAGRAGYLFLHAGDDDPIGKVRAELGDAATRRVHLVPRGRQLHQEQAWAGRGRTEACREDRARGDRHQAPASAPSPAQRRSCRTPRGARLHGCLRRPLGVRRPRLVRRSLARDSGASSSPAGGQGRPAASRLARPRGGRRVASPVLGRHGSLDPQTLQVRRRMRFGQERAYIMS